jgi:ATP-binding cassette, subfamily C, bacterial
MVSAVKIVRAHGVRRSLPLLAGMLIAGLLETVSIATMLPVLAIITDKTGKPTKAQAVVEQVAAFLHIPLSFGALCLLMATAIVAKAALTLVVNRQLGRAGATMAEQLRERLLDALLKAKWSYFTIQPVGRFVAAATSEANWASFAMRAALRTFEQLIRAIAFCGLAFLMGWQIALVAIALSLIVGFSLRSLALAAYRAGRARRLAMSRIIEEIGDTMAGFKPLKAMNRHGRLFAELNKDAGDLRKAVNKLVLNQGLLDGLPDLLQVVVLAIAGFLAARLIGAPIDAIVVAGIISFVLTGNVVKLRRALIQLAQADSTYAGLTETIEEVEHAAERLQGTRPPSLDSGCEFRNVSFSYGRGPVLTDATIEIPARKITTLIGQSGIGKTTIADLLLGLYTPAAGNILIDGVDLTSVDIARWRSMVGYVSQEIVLFNDTILANVALSDSAIGEEQVAEALRMAGLESVVADLPDGMRTTIGERGLKLSGGQRQRLALARALVHRPSLLILDEATSALDPATEEEICATITQQVGRLTVFAITHQRAWTERADVIYLVEAGGKVRRTSREELAVAGDRGA